MAEGTIKRVVTPVFRVSFPSVFSASSYDPGDGSGPSKPKFSLVALWTPSKFTDEEKKLWVAMKKLIEEASLDGFKMKVEDFTDKMVKPLHKGEEKHDLDGYGPGVIFATLSSHQKPGLIGRDRQPILDQEEFYAGCYARATITAYWYPKDGSKKKKKGVGLGLQNVQKVKDGEAFSGRVAAEEDFEDDLGAAEGGAEDEDFMS